MMVEETGSSSPGKTGQTIARTTYGDAAGYDAYMGRWSAALARPFLDFAALANPAAALDIGCGTGNLLAALRSAYPPARLVGIDPSRSLLEAAQRRRDLPGVAFFDAAADKLPFRGRRVRCLPLPARPSGVRGPSTVASRDAPRDAAARGGRCLSMGLLGDARHCRFG
jgi:SAM-dependent methyltransferase